MRPGRFIAISLGALALCSCASAQEFLKHDAEMIRSLKFTNDTYSDLRKMATSPMYRDMAMSLGEGNLFPGWRPTTRYELAVFIRATVVRAENATKDSKAIPESARLAGLKEVRRWVPIQYELVTELAKELSDLGVDVPKFKDQLDETMRTAFDDDPSAGRSYDNTPETNKVANDIDTLYKAGLLIGKPDGFHNTKRSGFEYAVAAHASYVQLRNRTAPSDGPERPLLYIDRIFAAAPLGRLFDKFSDELFLLGVHDLPYLKRKIASWNKSFDYGTDIVSPTTANRNIYVDLCQLSRNRMLAAYPAGGRGWRPPTRYEVAIAVHGSYSMMMKPALQDHKPGEVYAIDCLPALYRLSNQFSIELTSLGVDMKEFRGELLTQITKHPTLARNPSGSPEVVSDIQSIRDLASLRADNLIPESAGGLDSHTNWNSPSNYEASFATYYAFSKIKEEFKAINQDKPSLESTMQAVELSQHAYEVERLSRQFWSELERVGVDPSVLHKQIKDWLESVDQMWSGQRLAQLPKGVRQ